MKKLLLLFSLVSAVCFAQGQTVSIGARGGLSIPNLSSSGENETPLSKGYSSMVGPGFAVFADFQITKMFSIEPSIEYSAQGGKKDGLSAFPTADFIAQVPPEYLQQIPSAILDNLPQYAYTDYRSTAKFNYLLIPILAKFGWDFHENSPWRVYGGVGPFVGFLLNAKQVIRGNNEPNNIIYLDEAGTQTLPNFLGNPTDPLALPMNADVDIKDDLKKVNVGFEAKVGFAYKLNSRNSVFIEGGGNYGFIKIQKSAENGRNNTGAGIVMLGYAFHFVK